MKVEFNKLYVRFVLTTLHWESVIPLQTTGNLTRDIGGQVFGIDSICKFFYLRFEKIEPH